MAENDRNGRENEGETREGEEEEKTSIILNFIHLFALSDRMMLVMYRRTKTDYCFSLDKLFMPVVVVIVPIHLLDGFRTDIEC